jgi:hypothetical protein
MARWISRAFACSLPLLGVAGPARADDGQRARLRAVRTHDPVHVDGRLDEPAWSAAPAATGFRQREPAEGAPATEATEVRVLYDRDALYVGIVARDREPAQVIARLLERDRLMEQGNDNAARFTGDDVVAFTLDTFGDRRNAFLFATNANGAELDALVTDESATLNLDWRSLWQVAARRTAEGWAAEFAIPFRSLRYPETGGEQAWGFDVQRVIRRKNEEVSWSAWSRAEGGLHRVSRAGRLEGLSDLPRRAFNLELKPFGLAGMSQVRADGRAPATGDWELGADAKWELRPGLVLDATARPDFAQVEADDQIVNLTRFELYRPEKRDFFLENAGVFDFGTRGSFETPPFLLFFSRRIGITGGAEVPVLGGLRLSGRSGRQTLGLLDVATNATEGAPRTNFGALRVKRDVGGRSYVGAMVTDRRTSGASHTDAGGDASLWPLDRLNLQAFAARTGGDTGDWAFRGAKRTSGKAEYTLRPGTASLRSVALYVGGKHLTRVNGEAQEGNWYAGASFLRSSGDGLTFTHVPGYIVLDYGFDLAGRVPIAAGRYDLRVTELALFTSGNRPVSGTLNASHQHIWDGTVSSLSASLGTKAAPHLTLGASYTRSQATLPGGAFAAHVVGLNGTWAFSTRLSAGARAQYNSLDRRLVFNGRLRLIHRPGSDLYVVFNEERGEPGEPRLLRSRGLAVKLSYLVRF